MYTPGLHGHCNSDLDEDKHISDKKKCFKTALIACFVGNIKVINNFNTQIKLSQLVSFSVLQYVAQ